jgi:hypothetical protein
MARGLWFALALLAGLGVLAGLNRWAPPEETLAPAAEEGAAASGPALDEPLDLVPAESLLCWYGRPFPDAKPASGQPSTIGAIMRLFPRFALDAQGKLYVRVGEAFKLMVSYPHALALIDAQAKPVESDPSGQRVDKLRFAAIIQAGDNADAFARLIQAALNEQTDNRQATLVRRQAGRWTYQELTDKRLPDWCAIAWGQIGPHFVMTVGQDVWPSIAAVASGQAVALSRADWLANVRGERGHKALIEIIMAAEAIRQRLDPFVEGRATQFFAAWNAENLQRAYWALGFEGPAMYCVGHFMEDGRVRERVFADPNIRDPRLTATIPETARYAIFQISPTRVLPSICRAWLTTQGSKPRRNIEAAWVEMQSKYGFDAERDILSHLTGRIVMHNDPPHPSHVPLMITTLSEIRDDPKLVRNAVEKLSTAWKDTWNEITMKEGKPASWTVERGQDGVWYLQYCGLIDGPAWIVTDRFLITSWSPTALRSYLEKVSDRAGRREN